MSKRIIKKDIITTERLVIKPFAFGDRERLGEFFKNREITETFMVPDYSTEKQYIELADKLICFSQIEDETHLAYGVYLNNILVGFVNDCGFDNEKIEIGYVIHPDYKNCGFATEAVKAILKELWDMGFKKITADFFEENKASLKVMEKCGMTLTGVTDEVEYRGIIHKCLHCEILQ